MSATPLPALPINPAPAQPAPMANNHSPPAGPSFHAHLQSAQQTSQDTSRADAQSSDNTQNADAQASSASSDTSKPGADAKDDQSDAANDNGPGIDLTGGVGTLVSTVLNLIDHATGDTHAGTSGTAKQSAGNKQPSTTAQPAAQAAAIVPVLLPPVTPATTSATPNTGAPPTGNALAGIGSGLSAKPDFKADDGLSAGDAGTTATPADTSSFTQALGDNTQALAGSVAAGSHAALPVATTFAADNSSPSTAGITALGNLTATAPVVPAGATGGVHSLTMNAPAGSSGFAKELGQQITWLSGQDVKQAQIRLNPQNLGPLDVKVSVEHGRVDVSFMTQHPDATAAVQQSLGQLHQMLGGQGLSLGHATVGQHAQQQFSGQQNQQAQTSSSASDDIADTPIATAARAAIGLVDAFA
ncbi:flagellar hook-length control protein FliK [Dyella sp.]|uniref:flagellar hook-length control protein FliK n=1 Tax=Dyella sp. TaxID=1869338 RepID=UPI002B496E9B|nr:flagellar hook-length control protein FliK [Dyella sp.]HKT30478.1 flagellar hook-length control protein FliK [Dyella sp.]